MFMEKSYVVKVLIHGWCYEVNFMPPKFMLNSTTPPSQYLIMGPYLEKGLLQK